jgi:hypothetical protein
MSTIPFSDDVAYNLQDGFMPLQRHAGLILFSIHIPYAELS